MAKSWRTNHSLVAQIKKLTQLSHQATKRNKPPRSSPLRAEVGDQVRALLLLLDPREDHLRARDVLLRVDQVLVHVLAGPDDARVLVRLGVGEALHRAGLAPHDAPEGRALFHVAPLLDGVALEALRLEELGALFHVTLGDLDVGLGHWHDFAGRGEGATEGV